MEHISILHLFSKDTDATEAIRGFKYQELKTLETWLYNRVNGITENIYCDFEEDIFQRDLKAYKSTFKQIKLYSSKNFSLSSYEVTKALSHFFMLFVKGEYLMDETLFIFETNTSIANNRGENNAELLKQWVSNQNNLSQNLIEECSMVVKSIIDVYIEEQYEKLKNNVKTELLSIAKEVYDSLNTEVWENFIKSIRWVFDGITSEKAIEKTIENSLDLIRQLPFPIDFEEKSIVFDRLRGQVADKSIQIEPNNRLLTNELLDSQLLQLGTEDDKKYLESYELWKDQIEPTRFTIGEFYQVLFAAKHCRRSSYLVGHSIFWQNLLSNYYNRDFGLRRLKREAIYEIIWLKIPSPLDIPFSHSLIGYEEMLLDYFSDLDEFLDLSSLEDCLNLLVVIASNQRLSYINFESTQIAEWFNRLDSIIEYAKIKNDDNNILCGLLELEGFSKLNKNILGFGRHYYELAMNSLNEILIILPDAPQYAISHLGKKIDEIFNIIIELGRENDFKDLEIYSEKILPYVLKREGNFSAAKRYIEKGKVFLVSNNPKGILKAINNFQKAKILYLNGEYNEGYILAIMNISMLYSHIGLNLAAKYYAITAAWYCLKKGGSKLINRIVESYGLILHYDFEQGSWMSYLQLCDDYFSARNNLYNSEVDLESDEFLTKSSLEAALILSSMPILFPQTLHFINNEKKRMGDYYIDLIKFGVEAIENASLKNDIKVILENKLYSPPINDIGPNRKICWKAFGTEWNVNFKNNYINNSIGEEFASLIQIIQSEIAIRDIDFQFREFQINIEIDLLESEISSKQDTFDGGVNWKIYLPSLSSLDSKEKIEHYRKITSIATMIFQSQSSLQKVAFKTKLKELFIGDFENRALVINSYQKAYRDLISESRFNASRRNNFTSEFIDFNIVESDSLSIKE